MELNIKVTFGTFFSSSSKFSEIHFQKKRNETNKFSLHKHTHLFILTINQQKQKKNVKLVFVSVDSKKVSK